MALPGTLPLSVTLSGVPATWLVRCLPTDGCGLHRICRSPGMDRTDRCDFIGAWYPPPLRRVHRPVRSVTPDQEGDEEMIVIGVDSHKHTHTAVATDETARKVAEKTVVATPPGHLELVPSAH